MAAAFGDKPNVPWVEDHAAAERNEEEPEGQPAGERLPRRRTEAPEVQNGGRTALLLSHGEEAKSHIPCAPIFRPATRKINQQPVKRESNGEGRCGREEADLSECILTPEPCKHCT